MQFSLLDKIDLGKISLAVNYAHYCHFVSVLDSVEDDIIALSDAPQTALNVVPLCANGRLIN